MIKIFKNILIALAVIVIAFFGYLYYLNQKGLANTYNPYIFYLQKEYAREIRRDIFINPENKKINITVTRIIDKDHVRAGVAIDCKEDVSFEENQGCAAIIDFMRVNGRWMMDQVER